MKKYAKSIVTSLLMAVAFGAMTVGTTFALFTSQAKTSIEVEAGKIDLKAPVSIEEAWELGGVPMIGSDYSYHNSIGGEISKDSNNIIHLDKLAPGDGAKFTFALDNSGTNINTKARLVAKLEGPLAGALEVKAFAGELQKFAFKGERTSYTAWEEVEVGETPTSFSVTVEFPDGDNGQILFGDDNNDNQYQGLSATLVLGYEVVQGNATTDDTLPLINSALGTHAFTYGNNPTMYDALNILSNEQKAAVAERGYVWSKDGDQFYDFATAPTDAYKYFKMYSEMPSEQTYSIYATGDNWNVVEDLTVGFDAGETSSITSIEYDRSSATVAREVTIRTNTAATTLTINAPLDTINHYDALGALNIVEAATQSYHENGKVAYAEVAKGRIVLEEGSDVNEIHINKKTDSSFDTVVIANNGGAAELPEKITRDAVTVEEETLVVKVESNGSSENVYVYANGTIGTTEKTTTQNEDVESPLGQLVLDNGGEAGEKAQDQEEKETAKEEAVDEALVEEIEEDPDYNNYVARIGKTGYATLPAAFEAAVNGDKITMLKNVNLGANYILVNRTITLDLNGKSITGSNDPTFVIGASAGTYAPTSGQLTHTGHLTIRGEGSITSSNWDMFCIFPDAVLDVYGGNYTGFKAAFYIYGGTLNTYAGNFTATSANNTYIVQVKGAGTANIYAGNFTTPVNGGYGVYLDNASVSNFGSENGEGPTFNTWRPCIASNGSESHAVLANIYSGTYHSYRSDAATGENSVIQLANATSETQTLNVYGGTFEQTGSNENRCIFNVRYSGTINVNISGGTFIATSALRLFNGVGSAGSGWPSSQNVHITVANNAIPTPQNVKVYNTSNVYQSEKDFELTIE